MGQIDHFHLHRERDIAINHQPYQCVPFICFFARTANAGLFIFAILYKGWLPMLFVSVILSPFWHARPNFLEAAGRPVSEPRLIRSPEFQSRRLLWQRFFALRESYLSTFQGLSPKEHPNLFSRLIFKCSKPEMKGILATLGLFVWPARDWKRDQEWFLLILTWPLGQRNHPDLPNSGKNASRDAAVERKIRKRCKRQHIFFPKEPSISF